MSDDERSWRVKYREAVSQLAADEARCSKLEHALRLLAGRLCLAAQGRDARLDEQLASVAAAVRAQTGADALQELLQPLSQAVAMLDAQVQASHPHSSPESKPKPESQPGSPADPASVSLLDRLALLPELREIVAELRHRGEESLALPDLVDLLTRVARLASEQRAQVQRERLEFEDLLQQTTARLEEIEAHLAGELVERAAVQDDTSKLNLLVSDEVEQISAGAQRAGDIEQLRRELAARLRTISTHVQEFQVRDEARTKTYRERTQRMRTRIVALERESRSLHKNLKQEQQQAMIDALTGIPNRAAWDDRVAQECKRWKRFARPVALLTWDIDGFKTINDAFGHKAGDKVLRIVGQQLVRHVRDTDFVARYGGDEFAMLLVGSSIEQAKEVAEKIRSEIAALGFHFHDRPVQITVSCGVTSFVGEDDTDSVFDRADRALYQAKKSGKNRHIVG